MQAAASEGTHSRLASVCAFVFMLLLFWFACAAVLWWAYSMSAFIEGGAFDRRSAMSWVAQFSCILSGLIAVVWIRCRLKLSKVSMGKIAWTVGWQTAVLLFAYALVIVIRRQTWSGEVNDWAMFFGSLNARFFSETGPLSFTITALPLLSAISAGLFSLQSLILRRLYD